mmetsp:Transcript_56131/g.155430  ORF Transcript_56131/g.155430 Transcript_56131/m.155430 type:complete len:252 (-) Transcript_56131:220-975(-)
MSSRLLPTKGPCWTTGSPMSRPCNTKNSTGPSAAESSTSTSGRSLSRLRPVTGRPATTADVPRGVVTEQDEHVITNGVLSSPTDARLLPQPPRPPRSEAGSAAYESGGGLGGACSPGSSPATSATSASAGAAPPPSDKAGSSSLQNILKLGSAILERRGKLIQIWKSSSTFSALRSSKGNISAWLMPRPAVIHCTSPPPKRPALPSESVWSIQPLRVTVIVSKPRCGCPKSLPIWWPLSEAAGPSVSFPGG